MKERKGLFHTDSKFIKNFEELSAAQKAVAIQRWPHCNNNRYYFQTRDCDDYVLFCKFV